MAEFLKKLCGNYLDHFCISAGTKAFLNNKQNNDSMHCSAFVLAMPYSTGNQKENLFCGESYHFSLPAPTDFFRQLLILMATRTATGPLKRL